MRLHRGNEEMKSLNMMADVFAGADGHMICSQYLIELLEIDKVSFSCLIK